MTSSPAYSYMSPGGGRLNVDSPSLSQRQSSAAPQQSAQSQRYSNENTYIFRKLTEFEKELSQLTKSIQRYDPEPEIASVLLNTADEIDQEINQLEVLHNLKCDQVLNQNSETHLLNQSMRNILISLSECRKELNDLPKLSIKDAENYKNSNDIQIEKEKVNNKTVDIQQTNEILRYAMKLAKFSKIPRLYNGFLLPNNFIWPGDDNMRRGMLAVASSMGQKLIDAENGGAEPVKAEGLGDAEMKEDVKEEHGGHSDLEDDLLPTKETTAVSDGTSATSGTGNAKKDAASVMADLDLFDSDED